MLLNPTESLPIASRLEANYFCNLPKVADLEQEDVIQSSAKFISYATEVIFGGHNVAWIS